MRRRLAWPGRARTRTVTPGVCQVALAALTALVTTICGPACATARHSAGVGPGGEAWLETYIHRVRALTAEAKPRPTPRAPTIESWDPQLSAVLVELAVRPTADQHRRVALEYRRLGILDRAYAHLSAAVRLDPRDAAAFDGLARIWRDWGFPNLGLGDAIRAVDLAPASAAAANTLGTLLQALQNVRDASRWYERALMLDPNAAFAMNNLCYSSIIARHGSAVDTCRRAVAMAPDSRDARNNLALAHAAAGDFARARQELATSTDTAVAAYNLGILYLADRQFDNAIVAFDAAVRHKPSFERAEARARQARAASVTGTGN